MAPLSDTEAFLTRVVPTQGNYLTITWKGSNNKFAHRSYEPARAGDAVTMLRWATRKGLETYFAIASFNMAEVSVDIRGQQVVRAKREQANVHYIRALVMDADCKRDGDNKDPTRVFSDRRKAVEWLLTYTKATGMPLPNLGVNSGYGMHWYWILETPLTLDAWQPLADAMKASMMAHGWPGDTSPTVDGARILRPPGTRNFKIEPSVPVVLMPKFTAADHVNATIEAALAPWIGVRAARTGTHGGATISTIGARPSHIPQGGPSLNQNAHAKVEQRWIFKEIATRCEQVKLSLANKGNGDDYNLWYIGHISLAIWTRDGKDFIHPISEGDPRYDPDAVDAAYARAEFERDTKGFGAPTCEKYDSARPGVCGTCSFRTVVKSPVALGVDVADLPYGYRRVVSATETHIQRRDGSGDDAEWVPLFTGDVAHPRLDELPTGGHRLSFTYKLAGRDYPVGANGADMTTQIPVAYFERQGMSVTRHNAAQIGDFVMAWITQLRMRQVTKNEVVRPFGWNFAGGKRVGVAIAGTLYKTDGRVESVPGGDPKVAAMYRPAGDLANWRLAASLFEGGRPDMQTIIAGSFGAPLIALCGDVRGMTLNFWSTESGIGKSTAIKVGQSVWADPRAMQSMNDTPNAVMRSLSEPRIMIRYWDELRVRKDYQDQFVELIYTIPQGKERARMQSDTTLREVGEWETMLIFTSNRPCHDYLLARDDGTDSGLARLLEIEMPKVAIAFDPTAGQHIKLCETNYGHAGREYLKYLATNLPGVQSRLADVVTRLSAGLKIQRDERFSVTAMACLLVGAAIARKLGLFQFDIPGIHKVLHTAFVSQRDQRGNRTLVSDAGGHDIEEIINRFYYAQADYRVRTSSFASPGAGKVQLLGVPRSNVIRLQVAEAERILRVSLPSLALWLRDHNLPESIIIRQLVEKLGAVEHRKVLGGGTGYGGGTVKVLDIPLTGRMAELAGLPRDDTPIRPAPADAVL